ncbi:uncharacterized protein LOC143297590 [Babylonia areolata]|uniref:uncharacterized protein LOC143297590 n=1 Tax=Babylonia areolata TaxID=304850 RepID=UPI003FCFDF90
MASHQAQLQFIQFENWSPQEVAQWLRGLDESVAQYVELFEQEGVDGKRLLMLNHYDLEKIGISKLGHQELVLEAVDLLRSLRYTLETENLQSMALQLGCKARNVVAELQSRQGENDPNCANMQSHDMPRKRLSITVLSYMADMLATLKNLVSWLDRAPFEGIYDICRLRNSVVKLGLEMVTVTQRESSFAEPEEAIIKSCRTLMGCCDGLVQNTKDPLVIQPAALEQATIRKTHGEELGMNIHSAYNGIHKISSIKELSPADMCSKIEKGDELLQVNGQTVLGWQLKELVRILKDRPKEVTLLLKKRPRHINPLGHLHNHRRLAANHAQQSSTLPKSLKKRRSREGDAAKQPRPSLQEYVSSSSSSAVVVGGGSGVGGSGGGGGGDGVFVGKDKPDTTEGDGNDTDDVFRSGSESPQYKLPTMPDAKQRRATVSGGSPTSEHKALMVEDPVIRPKSQFVNKAERDAALAVLATAETGVKAKAWGTLEKEEVVLGRKGSEGFRATSSESSCDHKRPSESEVDDSVFSDKEDPQMPKPQVAGAKQEFWVTKPTPVLMEAAVSTSLSMSSQPCLAKTPSSTSSTSSTASTSTLFNSPIPGPYAGGKVADAGSSDRGRLASVKSPLVKARPPSPVSAPPSRKNRKGSEGSSRMVPSPLAAEVRGGVRMSPATPVSPLTVVTGVPCPTSTALGGGVAGLGQGESQASGRPPSTDRSHFPFTDTWGDGSPRDSASSQPGPRQADETSSGRVWDVRREKSKPLVLESAGVSPDHRPQSVQHAIYTEVATDTPHKDAPQLMKIKKLESPTAADAPEVVSEASASTKVKKRVEFSPDAKESSPPQEVSYRHIIAGGVVQKIPIETANTESPPVKMRQKSGNRRLDRRVSCKDLGKGDCEGWLYKRKEKDHRLAKHWNKHWCVLKNFNLYYYKNKEDLKAKGVIYLPAFQVSPAIDLKTKKFPFKVHNSGTTFYFASERQDDMSKWMNKMGLAAISFDTSHVVTTGGFIKPEPRSNHLGMANVYYSESEEEVEEGSSQYGSALSLNSLSSLGSATAPHPSPPLFKRPAASISSDPGAVVSEGRPPPHGGTPHKHVGVKGERVGGPRV